MITTPKTSSALRTCAVVTWAILAGCSAVDRSRTVAAEATAPAITTLATTTTGDALQRAPGKAAEPDPSKATQSAANDAKTAKLAALQINDDPQQFLGLSSFDVAGRLGVPSLVRRDGPAEIWQYKATACILDVFLYANAEGQHVRYVELRSRDAATEPRRCFARLLKAARSSPSG